MTATTLGTWRNRILASTDEAPDQLVANPRNWRMHPAHQRMALRGSLDTVGWVQQVIVNKRTGNVIDGHARIEEALSRNEPTVPVLWVDLSDDEEMLVLATLDPIAAMASTDDEKLRQLIAEVAVDDAGLQALLDDLTPADAKAGLTDPDDAPEPGDDRGIVRGDVFQLGDHRLMCGDSTNADDVARLMDGQHAQLCLTDPPYGADIAYATHKDSQSALRELVTGFFPLARANADLVALTPGIANVWLYESPDWMLCWFYAAGTGSTPWGFSAWQPVLVWGKDPKLAGGEGRNPDGFNWPMTREDVEERKTIHHVVPKPTSSWTKWMDRLSSAKTHLVYEPFCGSGTTIIAAEMTSRVCYAMEIAPVYVATAIGRWEGFTGQKAVKL